MLKLKHSSATRVVDLPSEGSQPGGEELVEYAGAVFRESERDDEPDYYQLLPLEKIDEMLDAREHYIFGSNPEDLELELEKLHPAPDGLRHVVRRRRLQISTSYNHRSYYGRDRTRWTSKDVNGWLITKEPYGTAASLQELFELWTLAGGPILTDDDAWSEESLNDAGFTCQYRNNDMMRVNFNPRAIELRPYRAKQREVKKQLCGEFEDGDVHAMFTLVSVDRMAHGYGHLLRGVQLYESRGWGHRRNRECEVSEILGCLELARKLGALPHYWRGNAGYGTREFKSVVASMLERIHGVEDSYRQQWADHVENTKKRWYQYVEAFHEEPEEYDTDEPVSLEEFLKNHDQHRAKAYLKFCRWLRREAKAVEVPIPKRPQMPKLPRNKKKKRKKRRRKK